MCAPPILKSSMSHLAANCNLAMQVVAHGLEPRTLRLLADLASRDMTPYWQRLTIMVAVHNSQISARSSASTPEDNTTSPNCSHIRKSRFQENRGRSQQHKQTRGLDEKAHFVNTLISTNTPEEKTQARNGAKVENQGFRNIAGEAKTQATTGYL